MKGCKPYQTSMRLSKPLTGWTQLRHQATWPADIDVMLSLFARLLLATQVRRCKVLCFDLQLQGLADNGSKKEAPHTLKPLLKNNLPPRLAGVCFLLHSSTTQASVHSSKATKRIKSTGPHANTRAGGAGACGWAQSCWTSQQHHQVTSGAHD